jgi:hypothetical protein
VPWLIRYGGWYKARVLRIGCLSRAETMDLKLLIVVFGAIFAVGFAEKARYDNYRVYKIAIDNEKQLEVLKQIENRPDGVSEIEGERVIWQN